MPEYVRLDGRVPIATGKGRGLESAHAVALAEREAQVTVNNLGSRVVGGQRATARVHVSYAHDFTARAGFAAALGATVDSISPIPIR